MKRSKTNSGILDFFERIIRSHPLLYIIARYFIKYTNIFEEDANGVSYINFNEKINIIDVGASDGIASKFFNRKLNVNKIFCYEPNKSYVKKLKKLKIKNLSVFAYAIGNKNSLTRIFFPRYNFFSKYIDLITYTYYDKKLLKSQINLDFKFRKNISIIEKKIYTKKIKYFKSKIDLIKIDVNGFELSVIKGLLKIIKRDTPVLFIETGNDITSIERYLRKFRFQKYLFSNKQNKFIKIKKNYPLNTYFLQKRHLKLNVI
tara:strand:- start:56 stop:835 length:780 start_codon:yes stop_codon:yes gene_type:complete